MYLVLFSTALAEVLLLGADWLRQRRAVPIDTCTTLAAALLVCGVLLAAVEPRSANPLHLGGLVLVCWSALVRYVGLILVMDGEQRTDRRWILWLVVVASMAGLAFVLLWTGEQLEVARLLALLASTCLAPLQLLSRCNLRKTLAAALGVGVLSAMPAAYAIGAVIASLQGSARPWWTPGGLAATYAVALVCHTAVAMFAQRLDPPDAVVASQGTLPQDFGQKERQWSADILLRYLIHETSQPLTAALANSQLMQMRLSAEVPDLSALAADVNRTLGSLVQIQSLVRRLRDQAAPSTSRRACSVSLIAGEVVSLLAYECRLQGVDLMFATANDDDCVQCDGVELRQIVWNLMRNALEAVSRQPDAGRAICCTVETRGNEVQLSVSDSGEGLPAEVLHKLGFRQVSTGPGHFGIGLAIVQNLVRRNGGHIELINSSNAASAEFAIVFPLVPKTEVQA